MAPAIPFGWKVESIDVFGDEGAKLHLVSASGQKIVLHTPDFGVGQRGRKAAALARFAEHCGFGNRFDIFEFIAPLPSDWAGPLFPVPPIEMAADEEWEVF